MDEVARAPVKHPPFARLDEPQCPAVGAGRLCAYRAGHDGPHCIPTGHGTAAGRPEDVHVAWFTSDGQFSTDYEMLAERMKR